MSDLPTTSGLWLSLPLAVGLAMDAAVVSAGISASLHNITLRHVFRLSWHFGLFQFLMPIAGWLLGRQALHYIDGWDHWVAFGLLAAVGGHMMFEALKGGHQKDQTVGADAARKDPTRGWTLVMLSIGTSLDALAVGLALPMLDVNVWTVAPLIGLVTAGLVLLGIKAGRVAGNLFGRIAEVAGGLVLMGIGVKILLQGLAQTM